MLQRMVRLLALACTVGLITTLTACALAVFRLLGKSCNRGCRVPAQRAVSYFRRTRIHTCMTYNTYKSRSACAVYVLLLY